MILYDFQFDLGRMEKHQAEACPVPMPALPKIWNA